MANNKKGISPALGVVIGVMVMAFSILGVFLGVASERTSGASASSTAPGQASVRHDDGIYPEGKTLHTLFDGISPDEPGAGGLLSWPDAGVSTTPAAPAGPDDGVLQDAWNPNAAYGYETASFAYADTLDVDAYGGTVAYDFDITYPQLTGSMAGLDQINAALRTSALSFVDETRDHPSDFSVTVAKRLLGNGSQPRFTNTESFAISYNSDTLVSVCLEDSYCQGSWTAQYIELRTVNANPVTGELYALDDVMTLNADVASSFVDNLVQRNGEDENGDGTITDDECLSVALWGRDAFEQAILGQGDKAPYVFTCFFVDGEGKVNLGVTYWVSGEKGVARGWWDYTLTDEQAQAVRNDSDFWDLLS